MAAYQTALAPANFYWLLPKYNFSKVKRESSGGRKYLDDGE